MPTKKLKFRCTKEKKCSAPIHRLIEIRTCPPNCGWGCDD